MTRAEIRFVQSLRTKKHRDRHRLFVAEGKKLVSALRQHLKVRCIYATMPADSSSVPVSETDMGKISSFSTPSSVLGVFEQPQHSADTDFACHWTFALDGVQDPANVGAIIRLCDWFEIPLMLCSPHTADCYSPKVVQATMGAIARIRILYVDLPAFLPKTGITVYGTFLTGNNIYKENLTQNGIVVFGSEGQGISPQVETLITNRLHIPSFAADKASESLNVATAAAIFCSEIRRKEVKI